MTRGTVTGGRVTSTNGASTSSPRAGSTCTARPTFVMRLRTGVGARRRVRDRPRRDRARPPRRRGRRRRRRRVDARDGPRERTRHRVARARPDDARSRSACSTSCSSPATSRSSPPPGTQPALVAGCARHVRRRRRPDRRLPARPRLRARCLRHRLRAPRVSTLARAILDLGGRPVPVRTTITQFRFIASQTD